MTHLSGGLLDEKECPGRGPRKKGESYRGGGNSWKGGIRDHRAGGEGVEKSIKVIVNKICGGGNQGQWGEGVKLCFGKPQGRVV